MPIPIYLVPAFDVINKGRQAIGCKPFQWNDCLAKIAQELANYADDRYRNGILDYRRDAHWDFLGRAIRADWQDNLTVSPPDRPEGTGNRGEYSIDGQSDGTAPRDSDGWRHPTQEPHVHAARVVELLTSLLPRNEGHVLDFRTGWNVAGIGHRGGFFILEYGYILDFNEPELGTGFKFY